MKSKAAEIMASLQDALLVRDIDTFMSYWADDAVNVEPTGAIFQGRQAIRDHLQSFLSGFREVTYLDRTVFPCGTSAAALRFKLYFVSAGGQEGTLEGVDVLELDDEGKVRRFVSFYNPS